MKTAIPVSQSADLRNRRRQRILEHSEGRLQTILKGPSGDEVRKAPTLEGGESSKVTSSVHTDSTASEHSDSAQLVTAQSGRGSVLDSSSMASTTDELDSEDSHVDMAPMPIGRTGTQLLDTYGMKLLANIIGVFYPYRLFVCIVVGILLRFLVEAGQIENVMVPWLLLDIAVTFTYNQQHYSRRPILDSVFLNQLIVALNDGTISRLGLAMDIIFKCIQDTLMVASSFLVTHVALLYVNGQLALFSDAFLKDIHTVIKFLLVC